MKCPNCRKPLFMNLITKQWEHSDKQKSKKNCNYVLITQSLNS